MNTVSMRLPPEVLRDVDDLRAIDNRRRSGAPLGVLNETQMGRVHAALAEVLHLDTDAGA